jgi:hypothetical protein
MGKYDSVSERSAYVYKQGCRHLPYSPGFSPLQVVRVWEPNGPVASRGSGGWPPWPMNSAPLQRFGGGMMVAAAVIVTAAFGAADPSTSARCDSGGGGSDGVASCLGGAGDSGAGVLGCEGDGWRAPEVLLWEESAAQ